MKRYILLTFFVMLIVINTSISLAHWADETINSFINQGYERVISFDSSDIEIPKGEFAYVVNKYLSFEINANSFEDSLGTAFEKGYFQNAKIDDLISREEACVVFQKFLNLDIIESDALFDDDSEIDLWAKSSVQTLKNLGIIIGYPDGEFKPKRILTKAELITMLSRIKGSGGPKEPPILDIIEDETNNLEVGIIMYSDGEIKIQKLEDELTLNSGDVVLLSFTNPTKDDETISAKIDNENLVEFDNSLNTLSALASGETLITFSTEDNMFKKQINLYINN